MALQVERREVIAVRDSRAGNDFHVLWAARRALQLIDPGDTLTAIKIEGLSPDDADDDDDRYLGCDASEYHGGDNVDSAQQIRLVQLKYSTKKPTTAWTAARLANKPTQGQPIVVRLAAMFAAIRNDYGPDVALRKTTIALVSNQPVAPSLGDALSEAKQELARRAPGYATARLLGKLPTVHREPLKRLWTSSGLTSGVFTDFLRVLDLSGCGVNSRQLQALSLSTDVASVLVGNHLPGVLGLRQLMHQQMMPEHAQDPPLKEADIIAALGASGSRSLFPYPSLVELPADHVPTGQAELLADQLTQSPSRRLIAHGGLGIGKSTTLLSLEARLPAGSVVVTYDCFAKGEYLNPAEDRHSYRACLQLANDLSLRIGLPPLVVPAGPMPDRDFLLGLEGQVRAAAASLADGACLVLAVDAADNAVLAATRRGESCFVEGLWRLRTASNVHVVMTARTARKDGLRNMVADLSIDEFSLAAFDAQASRLMLLSEYPDAGDDLAVAFHSASYGVARVQRYALDRATTAIAAVDQAHLGLTAIFDDILETALTGINDSENRSLQLAVLAVMPRPITKKTLAAVLTLEPSEVTDLVDALKPAVVERAGGLGFADEDFEAHLDNRLSLSLRHRANALFADYMWPRRDTDPEAAQHVAEFMFEANRDSDLITLARDEPPPEVIADGFIRARTYRTRVRLALQAASRPGELAQPGETLRLIIAAADAATTGTALQDTVREAPELAAVHVEPRAVAEVLANAADSGDWRGRLHFRSAAILARHPERQDEATEQLQLGHAWLRSWLSDPEDTRRGRGPMAADIANAALASFTLHGAESAWRMATQWRPPRFASEVVSELIDASPGLIPWSQMSTALERYGATPLVRARAALGYAKAGDHVPIAFIRAICRDLSVRPATINASWLPEFSTLALARGVSRDLIRSILAPRVVEPQYLHDWDAAAGLQPYLRAKVTLALLTRPGSDVGDLLPSRLKDETQSYNSQRESERRVFYDASRPLLPLMTAEVKIALAAGGKRQGAVIEACSQTEATVNAHFQRIRNDIQHRFHQTTPTLIVSSRLAVDVLIAAAALQRRPSPLGHSQHTEMRAALDATAITIRAAFSDAAPGLLVHAAQELCKHNLEPDLALAFLHRAADGIQAANIPVNERRDLLLSAAHAAQLAATPDALRHSRELFDRAVDVAGSLDADLGNRFRTLLHVADIPSTGTSSTQMLAERLLNTLEQAISKVYEPYEELPLRFGLTVASRLHAAAGLAKSFRWADDDVIALPEALDATLPACVRSGALSADQAMSLLHLRDPATSPLRLARRLIDQVQDLGAQREVLQGWLPMLTQAITCDAGFAGSATDADQLLHLATALRVSTHPSCVELRDFLGTRPVIEESAPAGPRWNADREPPPLDREHIIQHASSVTATRDLTALTEDYAPESAITDYLERLAQTSAQTREETLSTIAGLADVPTTGRHATETARVLWGLIDRWKNTPQVRAWLATDLPDWAARQLLRLFKVENDTDGFWTLRLIIPADTQPVRDRIRQEVSRQLEQLSAQQLHAVARMLVSDVADPVSRIDTVNWALDNQPDSPLPTGPSVADLGPDLFPTTMLAALAHEDMRYRWLAAHAIRDYVRATRDVGMLRNMLSLSAHAQESSLKSFRTSHTLVPELTARMWWLIGVERIAQQQPEILTPLLAGLVQCAADNTTPHAAIRELARRAARHIDDATHTLDPEQRERLQLANRPRLCALTQTSKTLGGDDDARNTRFHFNSMDTVPYWFEPLSRVFDGVTATAVTVLADRWVSDVWKRSWDEDCKNDPRALRRRDTYSLTQNDHGELPMIETAQNYLEYHAMQLAAGELVDKKPIVYPYRDDPTDPWHKWLDSHLPAPEGWLADARSPAPGHPLVLGHWGELARGSKQHGENDGRPGLEDLAVAVNRSLSQFAPSAEMIVVAASIDTRCDDFQFNGYVRSALVNPESIASLRSALHLLNRNPTLPTEQDNADRDPWSNSIRLPGLLLRGWFIEPRELDSLDRFDPLWTASAPRPLTLQPEAECTTIEWSRRDFQLPIRHQEQDSTKGCLTEVTRASLTAELARLGLSLLLQYDTRVYPADREAAGARTHHETCQYRVIHANAMEEELDVFTETYSADF
jgi:hypothetical protein